MLTIGSLFSGVGGLEFGLERAGLGPVLWQVECDEFCTRVLAKHWPDVERHGDVRAIETLPYVDLICGGFPCIDISNAGKRKGITGEHSSLWFDFARLIRVVRPRYVCVENVAAILGRGLGRVLGDLSESGYDAVWECVPAAAIGAPHRRDRLFLVAWRVPDASSDGVRHKPERGRGAAQAPDRRNPFAVALGEALADAEGARPEGGAWPEEHSEERLARPGDRCEAVANAHEVALDGRGQESRPEEEGRAASRRPSAFPPGPDELHAWGRVQADAQPSVCRLADGLSAGLLRERRQRLSALGNAVVPAVAEVVGRVVLQIERGEW